MGVKIKSWGSLLLILSLLLLGVVIAHAVVLAWVMGLGWLLSHFLPFSFFEGTLLAIITSFIVMFAAYRLLWSNVTSSLTGYDEDNFDDALEGWLDGNNKIPQTRFYKTRADKTWEAWLRYEMANSIYVGLKNAPYSIGQMGDRQLQELAIRLADIGLAVLKQNPSGTRKFKVTITALRKQMTKMAQKPYDNDILGLATDAINEELTYEEIIEVLRDRAWDEPCDIFD